MVDTASVWPRCRRCSMIMWPAAKHSAADAVAKAQFVLPEAELLRAMFDVRYFHRARRRRQ